MTPTTKTSLGYTYDFVRAALPSHSRKILEIGCGSGALASKLAADGLDVIAIDNDPALIEEAKARNVDARLLAWPSDAVEGSFDAILFTRSLHHISPLEEAVGLAQDLLGPEGRLIIEDYRAEGGSKRSSAWYKALCDLLIAWDAIPADRDELHAKVADHGGHHDLHGSAAIAASLHRFRNVEARDAAYYFRYLEPFANKSTAAALLTYELELIDTGIIDPLGKRFIAY